MIMAKGTYKIFKFEHSDGNEIIVADNAKEAIIHYFTRYQDDMNTEEIIEFGGVTIEELDQRDIITNRAMYNEERRESEFISYATLAEEHFENTPVVLAANYLA